MRIGIDARLVWRGLGIAQFVTNLVLHLDEAVELIWFGDPALAPRPLSAVRVDRIPYPLLDLSAARALARRAGVDVMHFTANTGWARRGSPPFVLTVHDLLFMETPVAGRSLRQVVGHRYARRNVLRALSAAQAVATPSAASAEQIRERVPVGCKPIVIPNGVDLEPRADVGPDGSGANTSRRYALAFSARDPRKGVELAVAGWRAAGRVPEELWLLAGAGLPPGLEDDIADEVAEGRIVVFPYVDRDRLREILAGASVLIYPSRAEGFGLPLLEAMAAGIPVISGLAPATRELGADAMIAIDERDPVATIAAGLRLITTDREAVRSFVTAGLRRVEAYSWRESARAYLRLYRAAGEA